MLLTRARLVAPTAILIGIAAVAVATGTPAAAADYSDQVLTAEQVKKVTKYDGPLEANPITPQPNGSTYASYRDPSSSVGTSPFSIYIYKYVKPKPTTSKPPKPDPDAPKYTCKSYESNGSKYTGVCWSKQGAFATSSVRVGKNILQASSNLSEYGADGKPLNVKTTAKQRDRMAQQAKAMRDAQLKKLGW